MQFDRNDADFLAPKRLKTPAIEQKRKSNVLATEVVQEQHVEETEDGELEESNSYRNAGERSDSYDEDDDDDGGDISFFDSLSSANSSFARRGRRARGGNRKWKRIRRRRKKEGALQQSLLPITSRVSYVKME
ncbi:unnamed protein product [Gongylonema pulchrum]|uniref:Uncharacterized protein n=1 Tax=Gongylonema pulchrum TaxID=637853 RepID=A0A183D2D6_9BILA|nr:unnamed protein product [Gongylonema pulchrum]